VPVLKRIKRATVAAKKKAATKAHDALRKTAYHAHRDLEIELARVRKGRGDVGDR